MIRLCLIIALLAPGCKTIQEAYEAFRETSSALEAIEECRGGLADSCMELQTQVLERKAGTIRIRSIAFSKDEALKWSEQRAAKELGAGEPTRKSEECSEKESRLPQSDETNRQIRQKDTAKAGYWTCICTYQK